MIEQEIFKQSFFVKTFTGDLSIIDKHISHIIEFDKGKQRSNVGGFHSNNITFGFEELLDSIKEGFEAINMKGNLLNFWLNINKGTDYNLPHIHGFPQVWSVVYYHKVCCDQSPLVFSHLIPTIEQDTYNFIPKNQQIVFFSGSIPHAVKGCNREDHERISMAFNFRMF